MGTGLRRPARTQAAEVEGAAEVLDGAGVLVEEPDPELDEEPLEAELSEEVPLDEEPFDDVVAAAFFLPASRESVR